MDITVCAYKKKKKLTFKNKPTLRYIFTTGVKGVTDSPRPLKHSMRLDEKGISYYFKSTHILFEILNRHT